MPRCWLPAIIVTSAANGDADVPENLPAPESDLSEDKLRALLERAEKGDATALVPLRELLKVPGAADALGGDLAHQARTTLISKFSGKNLLFKESVERKLELMRVELAGSNPTSLDSLLVDRIVTCWLHLHHLEILYSQKENMSLHLGIYFQRCLDRAQKRYLSAIKTLAVVRRLALPAFQVNIANKQQVKNA
jgi:hypothetical protein